MFVRTKTSPNSPRCAVQVVHNVRDGTRVRQKIIRQLGTAANDEEIAYLKALGELFIAQEKERQEPALWSAEQVATDVQRARQEAKPVPAAIQLRQLRGETVTTIGFHDVYGRLYDELGFDRILPPSRMKTSAATLKHVVLARLAQPLSKRATATTLRDRFGVDLSLERIYRMMDHLTDERIARIKRRAGDATTALLPEPVDVLYFDCTTLYFESFEPDQLRQTGYSKDAKFKETQVVLALVVTTAGLPITYEVFPGATFEGKTLRPTLTALKRRFRIRHALVVADRGMLSDENLEALEQDEIHYVVGARLRNLPKADQQSLTNWKATQPSTAEAIHETQAKGRRLVVAYAPKRAARDAKERRAIVTKLQKRFGAQVKKAREDAANKGKKAKDVVVGNRGYQRFLTIEGDYEVKLDDAKLDAAEAMDGLHGVFTSLPVDELSADLALEHYHGLWQVEAAFRVTKHDLQVRPIYHWKPRRIQAHIAIAFICLVCARILSYRAAVQQRTSLSEAKIRTALSKTEVAILQHRTDGTRYAVPMQLPADAKKLYQLMGIHYVDAPYVID